MLFRAHAEHFHDAYQYLACRTSLQPNTVKAQSIVSNSLATADDHAGHEEYKRYPLWWYKGCGNLE